MTGVPVSAIPAETLARNMVRRALANATRPDVLVIADGTGLTVAEVSAIVESEKVPTPARVNPPSAGRAAPTDETWRVLGKDHPDKAIRDLHARACAAVAALDGALAQYARTADMRQRAAQLRAELDQLEAQIGGQHVCTAPGCGRPFASAHALSVHRSRKHAEAAS